MGVDNENDAMTTVKVLDDGCRIHLQESEKLMKPEETRNPQLRIEFSDLCYSVVSNNSKGATKEILRDVTGRFEPGKFTVIIGPSGAGKTTLLKIILGERLLNVKGTVTINDVERNRGAFRKLVCYVPQEFDLLPFLTTRETLYIAARLKLSSDKSKRAVYLIVNEIAEKIGLSYCLDTLANKLSGGERKRLSIGVEMVTKPPVLLLDEPTSGLDSAASNQLINVLHGMSQANCTVVCAIHQPSSQMISKFDDIMVLDRGKCMYCGPTTEILNVYDNAGFTCPRFYNIAEFVLEVVTEKRNGDLDNLYKICRNEYEKYKSRNKYHENETNTSSTSKHNSERDDVLASTNVAKLSIWQQQKILFLRALICTKRDTTMTKLRFAAHLLVAILLGIVFYDFGNDAQKVNSNIACLFFIILFLFFANAMPAVQMFPTEAAVFLQEHLNHWYSLGSYYSVKILTDLPMQILCSSTFLFISYYLTGQPMEFNRVLQAWSIGVLITILGQTVGILTGSAFDTEIGVFLIPALSIPLLLFAGFFLKLGEMSMYLRPLGTVSFFRYAFEGIIQAIYLDRPNLPCSKIYCYLHSPRAILTLMGMPTVSFHVILIILGTWIVSLHIIIFAVLWWKTYYAKK